MFSRTLHSCAPDEEVNGPAIALENVPPWLFLKPSLDVDMIEGRREWGGDVIWCVERYVNNRYYLFLRIDTDGSKDPGSGRVGAGVYIPGFNVGVCKRVTDKSMRPS